MKLSRLELQLALVRDAKPLKHAAIQRDGRVRVVALRLVSRTNNLLE